MKLLRKSMTVLFIAFTLLMAFSCSSSDDDNSDVNPLVGVWEYSEEGDEWAILVRITINENKTGTVYERYVENDEVDEESFNFTWNTVGDVITVTSMDEILILDYSIDGDELELTGVFDEGEEEETMIFTRK